MEKKNDASLNQHTIISESEENPQNSDVSKSNENSGMLTPEQIAALFDSQSDTAASDEAPASNKIMTPEEIANLIAAQTIEETPAVIEETVSAEPEPKSDSSSASNGMLTPDQIAALFNSQSDTAATDEAPASNKIMSPEEIANLIAAQTIEETPAVVEETVSAEPEPKNDSAAASNGMLTPDQIAALFNSQSDTAASDEAPASNKIMSPEEIANLIAAQTIEETPAVVEETVAAEPELENESGAPLDSMVSQDQIAALFNSQSDTAASEDVPDIEETVSAEFEPNSELDSNSDGVLSLQENDNVSEQVIPSSERNSRRSLISKISIILSRFIIPFKQLFERKNRPKASTKEASPASEEQVTKDETLQTEQDVTPVDVNDYPSESIDQTIEDIQDNGEEILDTPAKSKKRKKEKSPKKEKPPKTPKAPKAPKTPRTQDQRSSLKVGLITLVVLLLMSGSFVAGNISRDFFILIKPDPAKVAALAEEKAKEAENKRRAEELAAISPKDYTSSMYLDSIILKGRAASITTIKLKKIDDVSKLSEFTKLRRIKLYDMTGDEDLSVIQKLSGVEEIIIENSVLKNQFANGDFKSVTSLEMTDCTVNDSAQFANFKNVTELYAETTKFVTEDGNLKIPTYMPSLETLTLTSCGDYSELVGVQDLKQLKSLELSGTVVNKTSYVQNPNIETITVDISFAKNINQVIALSSLKKFESLTIQIGSCPLSRSELSDAVKQIKTAHPDATVTLLSY